MAEQSQVDIYTDGACSGNPGPGGWAAILKFGSFEKEISGFEPDTTNNRMELIAAIKGLSELNRPCKVNLYSDSAYLVKAFNENWLENWQKNGWRNAAKQPVSNSDLWQQLLSIAAQHDINWIWVKGHGDNPYNNRCDELAVQEIKQNT
ncbi:MAG: ribonuclease HI [Saccharofermentanales bacterium]|jgi:ribonuclease HI